MSISISTSSENEFTAHFSDTTQTLTNAIRRMLITSIPVVAIIDTNITVNQSMFPNDIIIDRLSQIPIKANPIHFCDTTIRTITLDVKGKGDVITRQFVCDEPSWVDNDCIIIKLLTDNERVCLTSSLGIVYAREDPAIKNVYSCILRPRSADSFDLVVEHECPLSPMDMMIIAMQSLKREITNSIL